MSVLRHGGVLCAILVLLVFNYAAAHADDMAWWIDGYPANSTGASSQVVDGVEFTPNIDISITALGLYDDTMSSPHGFANSHPIGIWNKNTHQLLASATIPAGTAAPLINRFRFVDLAQPLEVTAGTEYIIAALGGDWEDPNTLTTLGNDLLKDPVITMGKRRYGGGPLSYPGYVIDSATRAMGPTFLWTPEPASLGLLALGSLVVLRRRG